jgi:hypothetical protein
MARMCHHNGAQEPAASPGGRQEDERMNPFLAEAVRKKNYCKQSHSCKGRLSADWPLRLGREAMENGYSLSERVWRFS